MTPEISSRVPPALKLIFALSMHWRVQSLCATASPAKWFRLSEETNVALASQLWFHELLVKLFSQLSLPSHSWIWEIQVLGSGVKSS